MEEEEKNSNESSVWLVAWKTADQTNKLAVCLEFRATQQFSLSLKISRLLEISF